MCDRLRIGLVGCGGFGDFFSDYLVQFADIAALCDVADAKKEEISNRHSLDVPHYTDYREMIDAGGLDAVAVTTVNGGHGDDDHCKGENSVAVIVLAMISSTMGPLASVTLRVSIHSGSARKADHAASLASGLAKRSR